MAVLGEGHAAIAVSNVLLEACSLILVWAIAHKLSGQTAAVVATLVYGLLPSGIARALVPLSENLFDPLVLAVVFLSVSRDGARIRDWIWMAVVVAAGTLTRPAGILLCFLPIVLWRRHVTLRAIAGAGIVGLLCLSPWLLRDALIPSVGPAFITTESGFNLLAGNNPKANGGWSGVSLAIPAGLSDSDDGRLYQDAALKWISTHPGRFIALIPLKFMNAFDADTEMLQYWDVIGQKQNPFGAAYAWFTAVTEQYYAMVLGPGLLGLALCERRRLGVAFVLVCLPLIVYFGMPRFHDPVMGLLSIGVGIIVTRVSDVVPRTGRSAGKSA